MNDRIDALKQLSWFSDIERSALIPIAEQLVLKRYNPGQIVFLEGEICSGLYIVQQGWLKVAKSLDSGREQVLRIVGAGEFFGESGVFTDSRNPATVIALEYSVLLYLGKESLFRLMYEQPDISLAIIKSMAERNVYFVNLIEDLSLRTVEARLARHILKEAVGNVIIRQSWATQSELASRLGTVLDVLNRALNSLVSDKLIKLDRRSILILDEDGLRNRTVPDRCN